MRKITTSQAGDTIVEVLIAIAIISLVLTTAYVTANRSYRTMLDAQERSTALKLLERQTEALKAVNGSDSGKAALKALPDDAKFCIVLVAGTPTITTNTGHIDGHNPCVLTEDANQATDPNLEPAYSIVIAKPNPVTPAQNIGVGTDYQLTATWDSFIDKGNGTARVQLEYGVY